MTKLFLLTRTQDVPNIADMETTMEHPIKTVRMRKGMTQQQLAEACSVNKSTISRLEKRRTKVASIEVYRRIGRALRVDWRTLVED